MQNSRIDTAMKVTEQETPLKKTALIMLGCPQIPIQTSAAVYLSYALRKEGYEPAIAGTRAARALLEVADPEGAYLGELIDLDRCIEALAEGRRAFDLAFVFVHNDAGVAYSATLAALPAGRVFSILFGESTGELAVSMEELSCELIIAPGSHNPLPLKRKLNEVLSHGLS